MTQGKPLSDLHEVFVSFSARQRDGCEVVYFNETLSAGKSAESVLDTYSYMVDAQPCEHTEHAPVKTFVAERYGGDGILSNGGGGRCGFDGVWQLKGLGPNQLVGKDVDIGHGDGNLSLDVALYETIWSEIIQVVLPFGAIRTVAVLDSGLAFEHRQAMTSRGLLVREPVVRPAHFMRAVYFKQARLDVLGDDAQRVRAAIARLVEFLPGTGTDASLEQRLERGLVELAGRYAEQFAAAQAKHIIHFNVSASNLSLDGAWLDLSSTCLFTDFIGGDRTDINRFANEYMPAILSLQSLCFYLSKYAVVSAEVATHLSETLTVHFGQAYSQQLALYRATQAGFALWLLRPLADSTQFQAFSRCLAKMLERDTFKVEAPDGDWDGYERWTARLFATLLRSQTEPATALDLGWTQASAALIAELLESYQQLYQRVAEAAAEQQIELGNFQRLMAINLTRLNRSHRLLHDLEAEIGRLHDNPDGRQAACQALTAAALQVARLNLGNEQQALLPFWLSARLSIEFDPRSGQFQVHGEERSLSPTELFAQGLGQAEINEALQFYRGVWRVLK